VLVLNLRAIVDLSFSVGAANYMAARVTYRVPQWFFRVKWACEVAEYILVLIGASLVLITGNYSYSILRLAAFPVMAVICTVLLFHSMYSLRAKLTAKDRPAAVTKSRERSNSPGSKGNVASDKKVRHVRIESVLTEGLHSLKETAKLTSESGTASATNKDFISELGKKHPLAKTHSRLLSVQSVPPVVRRLSRKRMTRSRMEAERRSVCVLTTYLVCLPLIVIILFVWFLGTTWSILRSDDSASDVHDRQARQYEPLRDFGDWIYVMYFLLSQLYGTPDTLMKKFAQALSCCCCCCLSSESVRNYISHRMSRVNRAGSLQMPNNNRASLQIVN